jgi:hypothetical protein
VLRKFSAVKPVFAFLAFLALALSWSLGTPLLSAADEPEQSIRAAAVVRGEFSGPQRVWNFSGWQSTYTTPDYLEVRYRLPHSLVRALAEHDPACYAFTVQKTAACTVKANEHLVARAGDSAPTHMNYSPLYYALVGWPSLFLHGDAALYAMRVVSALITAALLAAAFVVAARRGRAAAVGVVAAATPAAIYFGAVVNPSGLEITSALLAWVTFIALVRTDSGPAASNSERISFTIAAAALVLVRPLGPAWLLFLVAAVLATVPISRERLRNAVRSRAARWMGGVLVLALLATGAWDATQNTMGIVPRTNPTYTIGKGMHITLSQTPVFLGQMVGLIGWNDVHIPAATTILWYGTIVALLLAGLILGNRRERLVLLALPALVVTFPIVFEGVTGASYGVGWQGRYTLPLAVGVPLLAAEVLGRRLRTADLADVPRMVSLTLGGTLAVAYLCEVWWAWRRYAEGLATKSTFIPRHAQWSPVIGWPAMLGLALAGCAGVMALLTSSATYPDDDAVASPPVPSQAPGARGGIDPLVSKLYE